MPINYYQNAVKQLGSIVDQLKFIVVSDDIDLARRTMSWLPEDTHFSTLESPILDMILISLCRYKIISSSTFSWWGANLSSSQAVTLCPNHVIRAGKVLKTPDGAYPEHWTRVAFSSHYTPTEAAIYSDHLQSLSRKESIKEKSVIWRIFNKIQRLLRLTSKQIFHLI